MRNNNHIVIMAGGIGSRFWPMSTPEYPKQFVDVLGRGISMIQMTVERFAPLCPIENMWVVTSADYEALVREQLPHLPVENILLEPAMRNTAPCIAYACWKIKGQDPYANVVVTPADALVLPMTEDPAPGIALSQALRSAGVRVQLYAEKKKFKQKMSYADKIAVPYAVLLGEDEIAAGVVACKDLKTGEQVKLPYDEVVAHIDAGLIELRKGTPILDKGAIE